MDNPVMHPEDLTTEELNHELLVRRVKNLTHKRDKTLALRRLLRLESEGREKPPVFIDGIFDEREDFEKCEEKIIELNSLLESTHSSKDSYGFRVATSRIIHLLGRLDRLSESFPHDKNFAEARECVQKTVLNIKKLNAGRFSSDFVAVTNDDLERPVQKALSNKPVSNSNPTGGADSVPKPIERTDFEILAAKVDRLTQSFELLLKAPSVNRSVPTQAVQSPLDPPVGILQSSNPFLADMDEVNRRMVNSTVRESPLFGEATEFDDNSFRYDEEVNLLNLEHSHLSRRYQTNPRDFDNQDGIPVGQGEYPRRVPDRNVESRRSVLVGGRPRGSGREVFPDRRTNHGNNFRSINFQVERPRVAPVGDLPDQRQGRGDEDVEFGRFNAHGDRRTRIPYQDRNRLPFGEDTRFSSNFGYGGRNRRSIPINQWNVKFSGEENSMSLSEFLGEVDLFAESEGFSDRELFASAIHLFSGYARKWFKANCVDLRSWGDLVSALKEEFQSEYYDFLLLSEIDSRSQGREESFSAFLAVMVILFGKLCVPLSEQYKIYILRKNMLKEHAMAIATVEISTVRQLATICRRLDSTRMLQEQNSGRCVEPAFKTPTYVKKTVRPQVNVVDSGEDSGDELCELRRKQFPRPNPNIGSKIIKSDKSNFRCFNCDQLGHVFRRCPVERTREFCFGCGLKDVKIMFCPKCNISQLNDTPVS